MPVPLLRNRRICRSPVCARRRSRARHRPKRSKSKRIRNRRNSKSPNTACLQTSWPKPRRSTRRAPCSICSAWSSESWFSGILLKLRVAPAFRDLAERASKNSFLQTLIFVPLLTLLIAIISLPIDIYEQHISRAYGLSVQGWASWAGRLVQSRRSFARHPRSSSLRPVPGHPQEPAALVVLLLAADPAVPRSADLCRASHSRPPVQQVRTAGE